MSFAPQSLLDARAYLRRHTGLPDVSLGIVGGPSHDGGYHCGWDRRRIRDGRLADYSWQESPRDSGHRTDAASALDIGDFKRLRELSVWAVEQCRAGAPDTKDIREIIYSPDGRVVLRWDRLGIRSSGDSSHRGHTHFSYHRDAEHRDKTALFRRFFEPQEDDMQLDDRIDLTHRGKRLWAGELMNRDNITVREALMWGLGVGPHIELLPAIAQLRGQVDGLAELVQQLAAAPPVDISPEQLAAMTAAVSTAARGGAADALEAATARFTVDEESA